MRRRTFMTAVSALALMPLAGWAATGADYHPGLVEAELKAGKTVFLDFYATWCVTCNAQSRVISELLGGNPEYQKRISFIVVDWDTYGRSDLARSLKIPRRSTLVVLKGERELGRIVAGTAREQIKGLLDTALAAAVA